MSQLVFVRAVLRLVEGLEYVVTRAASSSIVVRPALYKRPRAVQKITRQALKTGKMWLSWRRPCYLARVTNNRACDGVVAGAGERGVRNP